MTRIQTRCFVLCLMTVLIFSLGGCAGTTPGPNGKPLSANVQKALDALDADNTGQAIVYFDKAAKKSDSIPTEYLFEYAMLLTHAERHEDAIRIFTDYISAADHTYPNYMPAHRQRETAKQKLAAQTKELERLERIETASNEISGEIKQSWKSVAAQVASLQPTITEPVTGIEFILVKGGCFEMGDHFGDGEADERPVHSVCVDDFYLGKYEVTQGQWVKLMGYNPSRNQTSAQLPVEMVTWQEATDFAGRLSGGLGSYRLPTEAEWEYAARSGGKIEKYSGSDQLDEVGWHEDNTDSSQPVGLKNPNALGFYDMSGNVYEWTLDRYQKDYYANSPTTNPSGTAAGLERTRRGGSWDSEPSYSRTSYRTERDEATYQNKKTGFRLTLPLGE